MKCPICDHELPDKDSRPDITNKSVRWTYRTSDNMEEAAKILNVTREEFRLMWRTALRPESCK